MVCEIASNPKLAEYLLNNLVAYVDVVKKTTLMTPLHWACYHGSAELADMICKRSAGERHMYHVGQNRCPLDMAGEQYMKKVYEESDQETGDSVLPEYLHGSTSEVYRDLLSDLLTRGNSPDILVSTNVEDCIGRAWSMMWNAQMLRSSTKPV